MLRGLRSKVGHAVVRTAPSLGRCPNSDSRLGSSGHRRNLVAGYRVYLPMWQPEERAMPVILLWAVPAVFVLGGLTYVLVK